MQTLKERCYSSYSYSWTQGIKFINLQVLKNESVCSFRPNWLPTSNPTPTSHLTHTPPRVKNNPNTSHGYFWEKQMKRWTRTAKVKPASAMRVRNRVVLDSTRWGKSGFSITRSNACRHRESNLMFYTHSTIMVNDLKLKKLKTPSAPPPPHQSPLKCCVWTNMTSFLTFCFTEN